MAIPCTLVFSACSGVFTEPNSAPIVAVPSDHVFIVGGSDSSLRYSSLPTRFEYSVLDHNKADRLELNCEYLKIGVAAADPSATPEPRPCSDLLTLEKYEDVELTRPLQLSGGHFDWQPLSYERGTYEFTIRASDGRKSSSGVFLVTVLEPLDSTSLKVFFDAALSGSAGASRGSVLAPRVTANGNNDLSDWISLNGGSPFSLAAFSSASPWSGSGSLADPYALNLDGAADQLRLPGLLSGSDSIRINLRVASASPTTPGARLLESDSFFVEQAEDGSGKIQLRPVVSLIGYANTVLADAPAAYWRFGEASGLSAADLTGNGYTATLPASAVLGKTGAISGDADTAIDLQNSGGIGISGGLNPWSGNFSIEFWGNPDVLPPGPSFLSIANNEWYLTYGFRLGLRFSSWSFWTDQSGGNLSMFAGGAQVGRWDHVVATWDASTGTGKMYVNGSLVSTSAAGKILIPPAGAGLSLGASAGMNWDGQLDEVAVYPFVLGATQVRTHYLQSGRAGCKSTYALSAGLWEDLTLLVQPTSAAIYRNGTDLLCNYGFPPAASADLSVGASLDGSHPWAGALGSLRVQGTPGATPVGSFTEDSLEIQRRRQTERAVPIGEVAPDVGSYFDPANAVEGVKPHASGCGVGYSAWNDAFSGYSIGGLSGFSSCTTTGWQGSGQAANPFRLVFDGVDDTSVLGYLAGYDEFSLGLWVKWDGATAQPQNLFFAGYDDPSANSDVGLFFTPRSVNGKMRYTITSGGEATETYFEAPMAMPTNRWVYLALVGDTTTTKMYLDGREVASSSALSATITDVVNWDSTIYASLPNYAPYTRFRGSLGEVVGYGRVLSRNEVLQNCMATQARYSTTPICSP